VQPPYVVGASQTFVSTFTNLDSTPLYGIPVTFIVTGANSSSGTVMTDANGVALFKYTGMSSGIDTIQATGSAGSAQATSNKLTASWIVPSNPVSTTTVLSQFFPLTPGQCCWFDIPPGTQPVFSQAFPTIDFNPPSGSIPGNTTVGVNNQPFTDVTVDKNGNFSGSIIAQGNGYQAGVGQLSGFEVVFTGSFIVAGAGDVEIPIYVDNSFILGIGGGATRVSGPLGTQSRTTPFEQYPVMGSLSTTISGTSIIVDFPGPGTYPFELDYVEDGLASLSLIMTAGTPGSNGLASGVPSAGTLMLSPSSVPAQPVGGRQSFTVVATDAAGNPVPSLNVGLVVSLNDTADISATTDNTGTATFTYVNSAPGTDQVQAVAMIDALARTTRLNVEDVQFLAERYKGHRNIRRARHALTLVDAGAESPRETWLRLLVIEAGYPRPQTQIPVYGEYGELVAVVDMGWEDVKIALEYEGEHHRISRAQFQRDIERYEALAELGWIAIRVTAANTKGGILQRLGSAWAKRRA